jgi:hypothetical protein
MRELFPLKSVNLELIRFCQSSFSQPLTDIFTLVTLQLQDFTIFWVLHHCAVAGKFLDLKKAN